MSAQVSGCCVGCRPVGIRLQGKRRVLVRKRNVIRRHLVRCRSAISCSRATGCPGRSVIDDPVPLSHSLRFAGECRASRAEGGIRRRVLSAHSKEAPTLSGLRQTTQHLRSTWGYQHQVECVRYSERIFDKEAGTRLRKVGSSCWQVPFPRRGPQPRWRGGPPASPAKILGAHVHNGPKIKRRFIINGSLRTLLVSLKV